MSKESTLNSKKIYLVAGEASGDLHGSNLMKALEKLNSSYTYRYYGGDLMQSVDGELVSHYKNRAVMGIIEVVKSLKKFKKWIQECKDDIEAFQPDVLVLIDYGGFNLRIAEFAHKLGIPVIITFLQKFGLGTKNEYTKSESTPTRFMSFSLSKKNTIPVTE